jgi:hypothetical protein
MMEAVFQVFLLRSVGWPDATVDGKCSDSIVVARANIPRTLSSRVARRKFVLRVHMKKCKVTVG